MTRLQCWSWTTDLEHWRWAGVHGNPTPGHSQTSSTLRTEGPGTTLGKGAKEEQNHLCGFPFSQRTMPYTFPSVHLQTLDFKDELQLAMTPWVLPALSKYLWCLHGVRNAPNSFSNTRLIFTTILWLFGKFTSRCMLKGTGKAGI